jgi:hypothetical protein
MPSAFLLLKERQSTFSNHQLENQIERKKQEVFDAGRICAIFSTISVLFLIGTLVSIAPALVIGLAAGVGMFFAIALISGVFLAVACTRLGVLNKNLEKQKQMFNSPPLLSLKELQDENAEGVKQRFRTLGRCEVHAEAIAESYEQVKNGTSNWKALNLLFDGQMGCLKNLIIGELWTIKCGVRRESEVIKEEFDCYFSDCYTNKTFEGACQYLAWFYPEISISEDDFKKICSECLSKVQDQ